jgi:hypothetical protein
VSEIAYDPNFWLETHGWQIGELNEPAAREVKLSSGSSVFIAWDIAVSCVLDFAIEINTGRYSQTELLKDFGFDAVKNALETWTAETSMADSSQWFMGDGFELHEQIKLGRNFKNHGSLECRACRFENSTESRVCWACGAPSISGSPLSSYALFYLISDDIYFEADELAKYQWLDGEYNFRQSFFSEFIGRAVESFTLENCHVAEWDGKRRMDINDGELSLLVRFAEEPSQSGVVLRIEDI